MGVVMSHEDVRRQRILQQIMQGKMTVEAAGIELGVSVRTVWRLKSRFELDPASICHKLRGREGNRKSSVSAISALDEMLEDPRYWDCGPTFLRDELKKRGHRLCKESVRQALILRELWIPEPRKSVRVHQYRERRGHRGELLQSDGCEHAWFEQRGSKCTALIAIDDATGRLESLLFSGSESLESYLKLVHGLILEHGIPQAFYTDRHGVFKVNRPGCQDRKTQFHQALDRLGVILICASTPQAKGRVERAFLTLQDRLVKWLRLHNISTIEDANAAAPKFVLEYNNLFAKPPRKEECAYRAAPTRDALERLLAPREQRKVSKDLSISFDGQTYILLEKDQANRLQRQTVDIVMRAGKPLIILWKGDELRWRRYGDVAMEEAAVAGSKELNLVLDHLLKDSA